MSREFKFFIYLLSAMRRAMARRLTLRMLGFLSIMPLSMR